jgi:hypothetical protein
VAASGDRLGGPVSLDDISDDDADEECHPDLTARDRETERERLRNAIDEEPGRDRLPRAASA